MPQPGPRGMRLTRDAEAEPASSLDERLGRAIAALEDLNHSTEQDFLKIGSQLGDFIESASLMSSMLTAMVDLISGAHGVNTSQSLENAFHCFTEMTSRYEDRSARLCEMRREAAQLRETLSGFGEIVSGLQIVGLLTRVEIARLGGTAVDFGSLPADVRILTENVKTTVKVTLENGGRLIGPIERSMEKMARINETQVSDLSQAFVSLAEFRDIQKKARDASQRLGARYEVIVADFKRLIVSVQFHDVTRQQIEHVVSILRRLRSQSEAEHISSGERRIIAAVVVLQSAQLSGAAEKFAASVEAVVCSLNDIASHIVEMAGESQTLSGCSGRAGNTYFLQMERGCTTILENLKQLAASDCVTDSTGGDLKVTVETVRESVKEIRHIEIEMKHTALNACIVADRIGPSGKAINVVALSMLDQALQSAKRSGSLFRLLDSLQEGSARIFGEKTLASANRNISQDSCVTGMLTAVAELHTSGERSIARIAEIVACGTRLHDELATARQGFLVGDVFARSLSGVITMLHDIVQQIQAALPCDDSELELYGLEDFAAHYTMQSERDVHERVTGVAVGKKTDLPAESKISTGLAEEAEELGDNVDFF